MSISAAELPSASLAFYDAEFSGFTAGEGEVEILGGYVDLKGSIRILPGSYIEFKGGAECRIIRERRRGCGVQRGTTMRYR